jgi:hypothetical protein
MPTKKKKIKKDDVDPKVLRKIKEPRTDLIDDIEEETAEEDLIDDEKTPDSDDSF